MSAPQKPEKKASSSAILYRDVAWKLQELSPESPKNDGSAEIYLRKTGMTPEQYLCQTLAIVGTDNTGECLVCKQKQKETKLCRIKQNGTFAETSICTDCINIFIEYNPKSVYDFEPKEIK